MSWPVVVLWINIIWAIVAILGLSVWNSRYTKEGKDG